MIIGHGDIASVLPDRKDLLFFASGVSNSQETRDSEYRREVDLLKKQDHSKHIVYFSTLAVFYGNSEYVEHKKYMETLIQLEFDMYTIIRIGNITWGKNPHTLINYLKAHPDAPIKDVYRYIVDKEEFLHWIDLIPDWYCEMNIPGRMMKVKEIKEKYVNA
jgi:hypothetical protein